MNGTQIWFNYEAMLLTVVADNLVTNFLQMSFPSALEDIWMEAKIALNLTPK